MIVNSEQMKRLEALEREARLRRVDADLEEQRSQIVVWAQRIGVSVESLTQDLREDLMRIAEVGEEVWLQEMTSRIGMTVPEFLAEAEQEWVG